MVLGIVTAVLLVLEELMFLLKYSKKMETYFYHGKMQKKDVCNYNDSSYDTILDQSAG